MLGLMAGMTGRFIHSSEPVDASKVSVTVCSGFGPSVVENSGVEKTSVAAGSVASALVGVSTELLYLGVGINCSRVSVAVRVTVGMTLASAPQADVSMETSKVKRKMRFIMLDVYLRMRLGAQPPVDSKNLTVGILSLFS